jgi:ABC-type uncharacterized transport system permease subunit
MFGTLTGSLMPDFSTFVILHSNAFGIFYALYAMADSGRTEPREM